MALNPSQEAAVRHRGVQLVLAGPGSGKTRVITEKVLDLLREGVPASAILALTFSDKAAAEMLERLKEEKAPVADLTVSTFHSFCLSVLEENVIDSGISFASGVISRANQLVWGLKNIDAFGFEYIEIGNNGVDVIESIVEGIGAFRDELIAPDELAGYCAAKRAAALAPAEEEYILKLADLAKVYRAYEVYKRGEKLIDFDDMIHETVRLFQRKPLVLERYRERYRYLLVDEFQDTNYAQLELVKQLASGNVCVVGDDDQTIYRFRGAYLTNFRDFRQHFGAVEEVLLDYNYRNTGTILSLALQLMRKAPNRAEKRLLTENPPGEPAVVAACENEQAEVEFVCGEIERLLSTTFFSRREQCERPYRYGDFAIVCRRRMEGVKFYKHAKQQGIPVEFVGEMDFFAAPAIRDAIAYLTCIENPLAAGIALNRILKATGVSEVVVQKVNLRARAIARAEAGNDGVYETLLGAGESGPAAPELLDVADTIRTLVEKKERLTLLEIVREVLMRAGGVYRRALREEGGQSTALLNTFYGIAKDYDAIHPQATLRDFLAYLTMLRGFSIEVEEQAGSNAVQVLTVHKSKGKEFPVVFVVDMAYRRFPLVYQAKPFYVPNDLSRGLKVEEDEKALFEQEERRLAYVAMTRAEELLYFTFASRYGENRTDTKPSRFLEELAYAENPLVRVTKVPARQPRPPAGGRSAAADAKLILQREAAQAVARMHLRTAVQRIVELEKFRLLEEGKNLAAFDPTKILAYADSDDAILALFHQTPIPLVGDAQVFSPSSLAAFESCPLAYKFRHVLAVPSVEKTYFTLGSAVHKVIEHLSRAQLDGVPPTKETALALLDRCWTSRTYPSRTQEREDRLKAEGLLDQYLRWQAENGNTIVDVEKRFQIEIAGRTITGVIDRLERTGDGRFVVVDFKTGSKPSSLTRHSASDDLQMNTYCLAVRELYGTLPIRAVLYYLKENRLVAYSPDEQSVARFEARAVAMMDAVREGRFVPTPNFQACRHCDYTDLCDEKEAKEA